MAIQSPSASIISPLSILQRNPTSLPPFTFSVFLSFLLSVFLCVQELPHLQHRKPDS